MTREDANLSDEANRAGRGASPRAVVLIAAPADIRRPLVRALEAEGFRAAAADPQDLDAALAAAPADVALLDAAAFGTDAPAVCARVAQGGGPAVILLGAGDEEARVAALDAGAGHCLPDACGPREIAATVRAALRARRENEPAARRRYLFAGWRLDVAAHELLDPDGLLVTLTDGEFAVLRSMVERPRRVLSRETLLETARGGTSDAFDRAVDTQISRIRRKLRASGDELIRTIRNEGYLFVPPVTSA